MYTIFGFYKFKQLKKISKLKDKLQNFIDDYKIKGTIIISPEGINGSISFLKKNTKQIKINLKKIFAITKFDNENISFNRFIPFHKGRVKVKKEVVPIGKRLKKKVKDNHLSPKEWNNFVLNKDTYIIDTRKDFEFRIGTFKRSINPKLNNIQLQNQKVIKEVRGTGLLLGLQLKVNQTKFIEKLMKEKLLTIRAGENVVRILPPLNVSKKEN